MKNTLAIIFLNVLFPSDGYTQYDKRVTMGKYDVGFETITSIDHARPYWTQPGVPSAQDGRPIQIYMWYPAVMVRGKTAVRFGDYAALSSPGVQPWKFDFEKDIDRDALTIMMKDYGIDSLQVPKKYEELVNFVSIAKKDATPVEGKFPVILIGNALRAGGYLHTILCEFLASHGFICVAVPSLGPEEGVLPTFDLRSVDLQINDLRFALNAINSKPNVNIQSIGIAAWSVGGVSAALLQMQNSDIDAVLSLDGATGYQYGFDMILRSPLTDFRKAIVPFLHMHGAMNKFPVPKNFQYYDSLSAADAYKVHFQAMDHFHFTSIANLLNAVHEDDTSRWRSYNTVLQTALDFFQAYINNDAAALSRIRNITTNKEAIVEKRLRN
jgi:dienelactone hydrolase